MLSCRKQSRKITNFCLKQGQRSKASAHTFTQTFLDCLLRCKCSSNFESVNPGSVKSCCMLVMVWCLNIYKKFSTAKRLSLNLCLFRVPLHFIHIVLNYCSSLISWSAVPTTRLVVNALIFKPQIIFLAVVVGSKKARYGVCANINPSFLNYEKRSY